MTPHNKDSLHSQNFLAAEFLLLIMYGKHFEGGWTSGFADLEVFEIGGGYGILAFLAYQASRRGVPQEKTKLGILPVPPDLPDVSVGLPPHHIPRICRPPASSSPPHPNLCFRKFGGLFILHIWPWRGGGSARPWPSGAWQEESGADPWTQGPGPAPLSSLTAPPLAMAWERGGRRPTYSGGVLGGQHPTHVHGNLAFLA